MEQLSVESYATLRKKIEEVFVLGQRKVEEAKVRTYWQTGYYIHAHILCHKERAEYGQRVLVRLAEDLKVGSRLLERTLRFYRHFPKIPSTWTELSWSHYRALLAVPDETKRLALTEQAVKGEWASRDLEIEVRKLLWDERVEKSEGKTPALLPAPLLGPFYAYQVIRPETIHSRAAEPLLDVGFSHTIKLSRFIHGKFPAGTILISTKDAKGRYSLKPQTKKNVSGSSLSSQVSSLYNYKAFVERVIDGDSVPRNTAQEMRVGPSEPICGNGLQSTLSGFGQKPWS